MRMPILNLRLAAIWGLSLLIHQTARADALDTLEAVFSRTSVRAFDAQRLVSDAELKQIMEAGWNTRTVDGSHPFEFIQIRDPQILSTLASQTSFAKWLKRAPAAIAVLVRTKESPKHFRENGAMAVMNMYYQAQALGLGITFQGTANREAMKRTLGVGPNMHLLSVIPVGAPRPGAKLHSPSRVELSQIVWKERLGQADPALQQPAVPQTATSGQSMTDALHGDQPEVLRFSSRPVEAQKLRTALEAMRMAPSSKNRQPWRWVMVSDPQTKARLARAAKDNTLRDAPMVAVLTTTQKRPPESFGSQVKNDPHNVVPPESKLVHFFQLHDAGCALTNFRLGAESQGLGIKIATFSQRGESKARAAISEGKTISKKQLRVVAAVGVGYAGETRANLMLPLPTTRTHQEHYGQSRRPASTLH
jgi:nitroreductase